MSDLDEKIEAIKNDIAVGKCVLVLGPDLYVKEIDGKIWERKEYFRSLETEIDNTRFFEQDEVFSTPNELGLENKVKNFFTGGGDLSLIELISTIKFPLILNSSPDETLSDFLLPRDPSVKFDYFEGEHDTNKNLGCDFNNPLIYNVFGKASDPQSLILSHNSLFEKIQQVLPKQSFPKCIQTIIENSRSFIFLGFKFSSWSYQLLSYKILSENKAPRRNRISSTQLNVNHVVNMIMSSAMGLNFYYHTPSQLLKKTIDAIKKDAKTNLLRILDKQEKFTSYLSYSRNDESNPNLETVVSILLDIFKEKNKNSNGILKIIYDKQDLNYGQSIDSFMTRIGKGKTVILVVSDRYLKSEYCMMEAIRVGRYNNEDERLFIVLIQDKIAFTGDKKIDVKTYKQYWKSKLATITGGDSDPEKRKVIDLLDIQEYISQFIDRVHKLVHLKVNLADISGDENSGFVLDDKRKADFEKFMDNVIVKMKED
jgi:hypothetical protein